MKKLWVLGLLGLAGALPLAACGSDGDDGEASGGDGGGEDIEIAVVPKYVGIEFYEMARQGAECAGSEEGVTIATAFEREHERVYGYSIEGAELEFLTFRIAAVKVGSLPELPALPAAGSVSAVGRAPVSFDPDEGRIEVPLYWRDDLGAGAEIEGPAIVGQRDSTTVLTPGSRATVDELGNLLIEFESEESR